MKVIVFLAGLITTILAPTAIAATSSFWYGLALVFIGFGLMFLSMIVKFPKKG
jgi:hypothetical protein